MTGKKRGMASLYVLRLPPRRPPQAPPLRRPMRRHSYSAHSSGLKNRSPPSYFIAPVTPLRQTLS